MVRAHGRREAGAYPVEDDKTIDVGDKLDRADRDVTPDAEPAKRPGLAIIVLLFALQYVDGVDQVALSLVAPFMRAELGLGFEALGASFTAGFIGTALGAVIFGTIADRFDRKKVLCAATLGFAVGSLLTIWARSGVELFIIRLATGMALGGLYPVVSAFALENAPARMRATAMTLVAVATTLGAASCGPLVALLQPAFGWRSIFLFGSICPAILAVLAMIIIPRPAPRRDTAADAPKSSLLTSAAPLFEGGNRRITLLIWLSYLGASIAMFFMLSWLPSLAHEAGIPSTAAALAPSVFTLSGVLAAILIARAIDRSGLTVLAVTTGLGGVAMLILGQAFGNGTTLLLACALAGAFSVSTVNLIGSAAAMLYDDSRRARGVGWAIAMMRLGAAIAPSLGGVLIARALPVGLLFAIFAVFAFLSALALARLRSTPFAR